MFNTVLLFGVLTAILLAVGWVIGGATGVTIALVLAILINFLSYWFSDKLVLRIYKAAPSKNQELNELVWGLAREAKIPKPRVYVVPQKVPNAFATGRNPENAVIAVTEGLLRLEESEISGVVAHEIGHIKNRDILVSTIAAAIAGAIAYIAQIGYWSMFGRDERNSAAIISIILIVIFAPLAALLVRMAISRKREYLADRTGVIISKNPAGLASALKKISYISENYPIKSGSSATSHMWIVNPFGKNWFSNLFSTHPPIDERIKRLERMAASGVSI